MEATMCLADATPMKDTLLIPMKPLGLAAAIATCSATAKTHHTSVGTFAMSQNFWV
jgi:hypothetical protein